MRKSVSLFFILIAPTIMLGQKDSVYHREISIGTPMMPPFVIGFKEGPIMNLQTREGRPVFQPVNVSYKLKTKNKKKNKKIRTGLSFGVVPDSYINWNTKSNDNYYLLYNLGLERYITDEKVDISFFYDFSVGYFKLPGRYFDGRNGGSGVDGLLSGLDIGAAIKIYCLKRFFIETETSFLYYMGYIRGIEREYLYPGIPAPIIEDVKPFWQGNILFSKLLGINVGYKF